MKLGDGQPHRMSANESLMSDDEVAIEWQLSGSQMRVVNELQLSCIQVTIKWQSSGC